MRAMMALSTKMSAMEDAIDDLCDKYVMIFTLSLFSVPACADYLSLRFFLPKHCEPEPDSHSCCGLFGHALSCKVQPEG